MTQPRSSLAEGFAAMRQAVAADAGAGSVLDAAVLALVLRLLGLLLGMIEAWQAGRPVAPRFRRHRRGLRPYRRRARQARARGLTRRRRPRARTPSAARPLPRHVPMPACARTQPPARASPTPGRPRLF